MTRADASREVSVLACQLALALALATVTVAVVSVAGVADDDDGQSLAYLVCFAVALPLAAAARGPLRRRLGERSPASAATLAAGGVAGMVAVLLLARGVYAAGGPAAPWLLAGTLVWAAACALALGRELPALRHAGAISAALAAVAALSFVPGRVRHPLELLAALALAGALLGLAVAARRVSLSRRAGLAVDVALVAVVCLAVVDLTAFLPQLPYDPRGTPALPGLGDVDVGSQILHQGFYLGPVSDVLGGRAVLVDTFSQYGVGVLYFLAGVFLVLPLGYGPMALVSGLTTGLAYGAAYGALRLAGCARLPAAVGLAVGIVCTQLNAIGSVAAFPSAGALRYGPAYLLILLVALTALRPGAGGARKALRAAELAAVGVAAVWSAEALAYALAIVAAARAVEHATAPGPMRARVAGWALACAQAVGAAAAAIATLVLLTRTLSGEWPDFAPYLDFLNRYSGRTVADVLVFPAIPAWSSGFLVGFAYAASALAVAALVPVAREDPGLRRRLIVAAAITAFGTISLSYWVTHGFPFTLRWVALPVALVGALWLDLLARARGLLPDPLRRAGLGAGAGLAALAVVFAWPQVQDTAQRTALGHLAPGPPAFRHDLRELWRAPRVDPRTQAAEQLIRREPHDRPLVMLTGDDVGLELLMRTDRANAVPLGYPLQSALIHDAALARIRRAVDRLPPGTLALTEDSAQARAGGSQRLRSEVGALLRRRFTARIVARTPEGLALIRLEQRRPRPPGAGS